jgi:hypothetical protein
LLRLAGSCDNFRHRNSGSIGRARAGTRALAAAGPTRLNVSTDWAPGSSGSAVLDECGNVIGHVANISTPRAETPARTEDAKVPKPAPIVFQEAVTARDVLRLIRTPK